MKEYKRENFYEKFLVSLHSADRGSFRAKNSQIISMMSDRIKKAMIEREFIPCVGDTFHFIGWDPTITFEITRIIQVPFTVNKLGCLIMYGKSKIFCNND